MVNPREVSFVEQGSSNGSKPVEAASRAREKWVSEETRNHVYIATTSVFEEGNTCVALPLTAGTKD
jgi:hypothetical protein